MLRFRLALAAATLLLSGAAAPAADHPLFVPVFEENFPDPFVIEHGGEFIAYSTNDGPNLPMATSRDLVTWSFVRDGDGKKRDGLPKLGSWAKPGFTWAPEVLKLGDKWLLYYTASDRKRNAQCIGVAVASDPKGPFVDTRSEPILCQEELGGAIDANPFRDKDGKLYLYWKTDGNRVRRPTDLWGAELAPDGLSLAGKPVDLGLSDAEGWKQRVIEAPTMIRTPDGLAMLYSAGYFGWNDDQRLSPYSMTFALCSGPLGPCRDGSPKPLLHSFSDKVIGCVSGPGHQSVFRAQGGTFISFHGWATASNCRKGKDARYLYIAPFGWENGKPELAPSLRPVRTKVGERG